MPENVDPVLKKSLAAEQDEREKRTGEKERKRVNRVGLTSTSTEYELEHVLCSATTEVI